MNRSFNPTPKPIRSALAIAAVLATALIAASIDGLAQHYEVSALVAQLPAVVVAAR